MRATSYQNCDQVLQPPLEEQPTAIERTVSGADTVTALGTTILAAAILWLASSMSQAFAAVPGLTTVRATSVSDSARVKAAVAVCPAGTVPLGGGYQLGGTLNRGEVHVPELRPVGNGMEAVAYEDEDGFAANWTVQAIAVCAEPLPGLELLTATSFTDSATDKGVAARCPGEKQLVGTAVEVGGGAGHVVVNSLQPFPTFLIATAHEEENGTTNVWNVKAHAFCADPLPGLSIETDSSATTTADYKGLTVTCPPGKGVLGAGAYISQNTGEIALEDLNLGAAFFGQYMTASAADDGNGYSGTFWRLDAHAICADL